MVRLSNEIRSNIRVSAQTDNVNANTLGNSQRAKSWAVGEGLIDGEDHSAKYYAGQAKQAEQTATEAISHIGTSVEDAADYAQSASDSADAAALSAQSAQSSAEYVVNNAPTVTVEQTSTGAIVTATDLQGTTTATILNGAKGVSIVSNELYSSSGLYDTYRQTFSDGSHFDYVVKNGADGGYTLPIASSNTLGGVKIGNNLSIDQDGVLSATASGTVDQTFDPTSQNAQSGVAINGAGFLQNISSNAKSISVLGTATDNSYSINIGKNSSVGSNNCIAIGYGAQSQGNYALGFGYYARALARNAIQLGFGTNNTADSLQIGSYPLLDTSTGLIPDARLSSNIARSSAIPTSSTIAAWGFITGINSSDVTTALGYTPYNSSNPNGYTSNVGTVTSVNNIQPDTNGNVTISTRNVGEVITSTLPLTDAGLHLLDGTLLQYGIYQEFIDYIADLYAENPTANYFTDETTWQTSVTTYGSCGKFVYDSVSKTVRLPKVSNILQGTTDINALGDLIEAGLPPIKGSYYEEIINPSETGSGAFKVTGTAANRGNTNGSYGYGLISFDASRSSSIYGNSTTVQPQTIKAFVYIVIANSTKTNIQVDIDEIATDLNNKAGTDLANVTKTGKVLMSGMGMPSNKALTFTVGASGSNITIPANGWLAFRGKTSVANQFVSLKISGGSVYREEERQVPYVNGWVTILIPVNAGDTVTYYYNINASDISQFQLIYAQGSKN